MEMATDTPSSFEKDMIKTVGGDMSKQAADACYRKSGLSPRDVQVVELHDCFSANEVITYEALSLCPEGQAGKFIDKGDNTYGGNFVINPSGGLISKGHPLGATGIAQCAELSWQLRGQCGPRQVPNARVGLQHNVGLGGAAVVALYRLGFPEAVKPLPAGALNPAIDEAFALGIPLDYGQAASPGKPAAPATAAKASTAKPAASSGTTMQSDLVFAEMGKRLNADMVAKVGASYRFNITGGGVTKSWLVNLKSGSGNIAQDANSPADTTLTASDADFVGMMTGKLDAQELFFQGKLKLSGDFGNASKLSQLTASSAKL